MFSHKVDTFDIILDLLNDVVDLLEHNTDNASILLSETWFSATSDIECGVDYLRSNGYSEMEVLDYFDACVGRFAPKSVH